MHFNPRIFIPFLFLWFVGCSVLPSEMKIAEQVMETAPDSALHLLQRIQPNHNLSDADRALYGLLYFQALDKNNLPLKPDSLINFSLDYYQRIDDKLQLAKCYFYKARSYKSSLLYEDATSLYLKALDNIQNKNDYDLLGKIYGDIGDISFLQHDYKESRIKFLLSIECFNKKGESLDVSYKLLDIGRTYYAEKDYKTAQKYFRKALFKTTDSLLCGSAFQEIGVNFFWAKQYDSAQYYLRKSTQYPYIGYNLSVRCYTLSDSYFNTQQYDSAFLYATIAIKQPSNFYTKRECYRILANTAYVKGNFKQMALYMTYFQAYSDSVRKIESQTKTTVLEDIHQTTEAAGKTKQYLTILGWILPFLITISLIIVIRLRKRNKGNEEQLEVAELQLSEKQTLLKDSLKLKIEETRVRQASTRKKATLAEKELMDKELYYICLHVDEWNKFVNLMNRTFNNLIVKLETSYPDITHKEIIWCCLYLLDVPTPEVLLLLEYKQDSMYKLKQRLVQKLNLKNTKELESLLEQIVETK